MFSQTHSARRTTSHQQERPNRYCVKARVQNIHAKQLLFVSSAVGRTIAKRSLRESMPLVKPTIINVILGKSPGETLRNVGHDAYGLESQKNMCQACFNRKYGRNNWRVVQWYIRDVSARKSKIWPKQLQAILDATKDIGGVLATSHVCRMLRNKKDLIAVEDSKVPLLVCDHDALDTTTPRGKNIFGKLVLDAEYEADIIGERVRKALQVAKKRGTKLGTQNKRVAGKAAKAITKAALERSRALLPFIKKHHDKGHGAKTNKAKLNAQAKAVKINRGKFHVSTTQNHIKRLVSAKLLKRKVSSGA